MDKKKFKLLIVDDEEDLREILTFNLASEGYQVSTAANAEEALKMPLEEYHLLILDVMMPGMDGFEVLEHLRHASSIPVILLTAKNRVDDRIRGLTLGADDYLGKPFAIDELTARIEAVSPHPKNRKKQLPSLR